MTMNLKTGLLGVLLLSATGSLAGAEMRGLLVFGHEVRSLQLCGDSKVFWIHAPGPLHQRLQNYYRRFANRPYEPLYIEIEGEFSEQPASGFAADYDGTVVVSEVRLVSGAGIEACGAGQPVSVRYWNSSQGFLASRRSGKLSLNEGGCWRIGRKIGFR